MTVKWNEGFDPSEIISGYGYCQVKVDTARQ